MSLTALALTRETIPWRLLLWPFLVGLGLALLLTAQWQPIGRPRPDLAERLRRLDVDERVRMAVMRTDRRPIFRSRLGEALIRPLLDDLGRLLHQAAGRVGAGGPELGRKLALVRPGLDLPQWYGEKLVSGLIGLAVIPAMGTMGVHPSYVMRQSGVAGRSPLLIG